MLKYEKKQAIESKKRRDNLKKRQCVRIKTREKGDSLRQKFFKEE